MSIIHNYIDQIVSLKVWSFSHVLCVLLSRTTNSPSLCFGFSQLTHVVPVPMSIPGKI